MLFLHVLSIIACCSVLIGSVILGLGIKKMRRLGDITVIQPLFEPLVSIIVPACNEQQNIEKALLSLVAQDYKNVEIIVVNDRSTDDTAKIIEKIQDRYPRIIIHTVKELPKDWMGKSHALAVGADLATGDYLVFTDADVIMEKTSIARAVKFASQNELDHLTLVFKNITRGWVLNSLILDSGLALLFIFRPWAARKKDSYAFVGIGAFNMIKKSVYNQIGGHEKFKMHPIEDMMLGKTIKAKGFRQDCLLAYEFISVPWYDSVTAMVSGLEKNMFAVLHYRLWLVPPVLCIVFVLTILPFWGALLASSFLQVVCIFTIMIRFVVFYCGLRMQGLSFYYLPGAVITPYISSYILLKSVIAVLKCRGIVWRGQHYDLEEMRKAEPLIF